jgi:integrase
MAVKLPVSAKTTDGRTRVAKRGNGEGSIYQVKNRKTGKKDRWIGVYTVRAATGTKRREVSGKTRTEVAGKPARAIADREGGLVFDAGKLTVGQYLDRWLADSVWDTVRLTTYQGYERIVRRHLKPTLGSIKLKSLTPTHARGLYRERLDSGLAPRMVQLAHTTLHKALKQAVMDGLIPRNATEAVRAPKVGRREITLLSAQQTKELLQAACEAGDRFEALYAVAVGTGMRQGEMLGLKWEDVDLERGVVQVRRTLSTANGKGFAFGEPKTARSRRSIKLPALALAALERHRRAQLREETACGAVAGQRPRLRQPQGQPRVAPGRHHPQLQTAPAARRAARRALPRPPPHLRDHPPASGQTPQVRPGASQTRHYLDHAGHLQPRHQGHGGRPRRRHRRGSRVAFSGRFSAGLLVGCRFAATTRARNGARPRE